MAELEVDFLIVGAGPAGASLACFLAQHGMKALAISSAPGTSDTPRAHLLNPFGVECLRDLGIEDEAVRMGVTGGGVDYFRWCDSILGEEYGKVYMWGSAPSTKRDVTDSTPCHFMDLPQSYLEPILLKYASTHGITVRFSTALQEFKRDKHGILSTVKDLEFGTTYTVRSRFIFGSDGGRSTVARKGGFEFDVQPSSGVACNILFNADLDGKMDGKEAEIQWVTKPDRRYRLCLAPAIRQIRPWKQWMMVAFSPGTDVDPFQKYTPQSEELIGFIRECIGGKEDVDLEILRLDSWFIRETVAKSFMISRDAFLLGDAAHRHPPAFGLGGNTSIQDAYNLAWKVAYVTKGLAGPALLDSYNEERLPIGRQLVRASNEEMGRHVKVFEALGMFSPTAEEGARWLADLKAPTGLGEERREALHKALEGKRNEGESLGLDMNQWYTSSAVYLDDEAPRPEFKGDPITEILISSYPGNRLPHAWLTRPNQIPQISTVDLAGHCAFSIFTGHGGEAWTKAAAAISKSTGIPINAYSIGFGLDYHDQFRDWTKRREVGEAGCILVRPDRFVAWRSKEMVPDCHKALTRVLDRVLSREELAHR